MRSSENAKQIRLKEWMTPHVKPSCLAQYKLPKNREGIATLATQVDLIELSLRGTSLIERKLKRKRKYYYIYIKITEKFGGERLGREKFHGWNYQAYQN